ncbi:C5 [Pepper leaf curl Bangladesh virus]|uniref:C5 n=1 Tax=Pepper leaf curl Bangladesh virus TaxID=223305 RepID=Q0R4T2_9GEMI|nr:C5 [Pepper leaf curl Bangladesh virus]
MPLPQHLVPVSMDILYSSRTGLIIKHVKHLTEILRLINGPTIPNKKKHNTIRMILSLDVLIHPDLAQNVNRLNTEPLPNPVGQSSTTRNITNTHDFTNVLDITSRLKKLDLTRAFTAPRNIWASVHPVHPGLPVHGPVRPCSGFCDADNGGSSTAGIWAVEVETAAYLRGGRGNDYICWSLGHNS